MYSRKGAPVLAKAQRDAVCTCACDILNRSMIKEKLKVNLQTQYLRQVRNKHAEVIAD